MKKIRIRIRIRILNMILMKIFKIGARSSKFRTNVGNLLLYQIHVPVENFEFEFEFEFLDGFNENLQNWS